MSSKKDLDIRFTVDPTSVDLTADEMENIESAVVDQIMGIVSQNNLGELAWLEVGGYAKFSKETS